MDSRKICFIICSNKEEYFAECAAYLERLEVPVGMEAQIAQICKASSMASGYNEGMGSSDAQYKVYMHEDVFIVNRRFIQDVLDLFQADSRLGMLGMVGSPRLPADAVMWHGERVWPEMAGIPGEYRYCPEQKAFEVEAADGMLLVTQQDIPWREDLFDGWDFYDISQCFEMLRAGYKVMVPVQEKPWCIHGTKACVNLWQYDKYRQRFMKEYGEKGKEG